MICGSGCGGVAARRDAVPAAARFLPSPVIPRRRIGLRQAAAGDAFPGWQRNARSASASPEGRRHVGERPSRRLFGRREMRPTAPGASLAEDRGRPATPSARRTQPVRAAPGEGTRTAGSPKHTLARSSAAGASTSHAPKPRTGAAPIRRGILASKEWPATVPGRGPVLGSAGCGARAGGRRRLDGIWCPGYIPTARRVKARRLMVSQRGPAGNPYRPGSSVAQW